MENAGHTVDGGTRGETEAVKAAIEESVEDKQNGNAEDEKPDLKRKGTMQETIEVRKTAARVVLKPQKIAHSQTSISCQVLIFVVWKSCY